MPSEDNKTKRVLLLKVRAPSADAAKMFVSMMKSATPLYAAFGDARIRLLHNADDPAQFIQVVEYQVDKDLEATRQKLSSDPVAQKFAQTWRAMFPGAFEVDVYEDVTERDLG